MAVFCLNCGKQAEGQEQFCLYCGAQLPPEGMQPMYPNAQQGYQPMQQGYQPMQRGYNPQQQAYPGYPQQMYQQQEMQRGNTQGFQPIAAPGFRQGNTQGFQPMNTQGFTPVTDGGGYNPPKEKNRKKTILTMAGIVLAIAAVVVILLLTGVIEGGSKGLEGTWKFTGVKDSPTGFSDVKLLLDYTDDISLTFKDGKITISATMFGESMEQELCEYTVSGDQLEIDGLKYDYKIDGKKLTITNPGGTIELERK